jgi:hypothetical protein
MIPFSITNSELTFFANSRPWSVNGDHPDFEKIKRHVIDDDLPDDELIKLADHRQRFAGLGLEIGHDCLFYRGVPLHNVWTDKILQFRAQGIPHEPLLRALDDLLQNPSYMARERLPLFVERNKLGVLPDGRIAAMKVVRNNFKDVHSGKLDNSPGRTVSMPRHECDDDPDNACSAGLHVGALEYLQTYGLYSVDRSVILTAFWPRNAVSVPKDHNETKLRVCEYEVLSVVDPVYVEEFIAKNQTIVSPDYDD